MSKQMEYEVAVVGASVAGSVCATTVAPFTSSLALIDAETFPRRKTCGEGLANEGYQRLSRLGIDFGDLPHSPLTGYRIVRKATEVLVPLLTPDEHLAAGGVGISRMVLDNALLQRATCHHSVQPLLGNRIRHFEEHPEHCELTFADGSQLFARYLVVASGAHARSFLRSAKPHTNLRYAYSQPFEILGSEYQPAEVHIFLEKGFEIYITPTGDNVMNIAVLAKRKSFPELFRREGQVRIVSKLEKHFGLRLRALAPALPTGPLGNLRRPASSGRVFFVGDACEQFDPIGGMGITHAAMSGEIAGHYLTKVLQQEMALSVAAKSYEEQRDHAARPLRGFTRLTYLMLVQMAETRLSHWLTESPMARRASQAIHGLDHRTLTRLSYGFLNLAGL